MFKSKLWNSVAPLWIPTLPFIPVPTLPLVSAPRQQPQTIAVAASVLTGDGHHTNEMRPNPDKKKFKKTICYGAGTQLRGRAANSLSEGRGLDHRPERLESCLLQSLTFSANFYFGTRFTPVLTQQHEKTPIIPPRYKRQVTAKRPYIHDPTKSEWAAYAVQTYS